MKENKYKNESEDYELNYNLRKKGLSCSEDNRDMLKIFSRLEKDINNKATLTNTDYDKIIDENRDFFDKCEQK